MIFSDLFFIYCFLPVFLLFYFIGDITVGAVNLFSRGSSLRPRSFMSNNPKHAMSSDLPTSLRTGYKNVILAAFSLVFYAWGEPTWVILLITASIVAFFAGVFIEKYRDTKYAAVAAAAAIIFCLCMLGVFKYTGFVTDNINAVFHTNIAVPKIALPIGISFYTFQIVSYILDCLWGKINVQKNFLKFFTYVAMFPQLVAGPIVRYQNIEGALDNRRVTAAGVSEGITRFAVGLGKKVIIANNLSTIVDGFFKSTTAGAAPNIAELSVTATWLAVITFALQVYFDFSGYSDMAIGLGKIIGFNLNENFNYPFISKNITEFWQRWHISLGSFFRDYLLYVPIFGKRRQYASLFLVWFCTGLWHGASWNYIIWGLYFGVFILVERLIGNKRMKKIPNILSHLYCTVVFVVGFGIFYFTDFGNLSDFFKNLVGANHNAFADELSANVFMNNVFLLIAAVALSVPLVPFLKKLLLRFVFDEEEAVTGVAVAVCNAALLCVSSILLVNATNNPFLYFNF